ncbi:MAG: hypothetical protein ACYDCX_06065, partial [Acidithiobacillus sp.]
VANHNVFGLPWNSPVVFAQYDPNTVTGSIYVVRLTRMPNGDAVVMEAQYSPSYGQTLATDYKGANPFWQFQASGGATSLGNGGAFTNITQAAFYTAVGVVMQQLRSQVGWIATANTQSRTWTTSHGGLFTKTVTQHEQATTTPNWTMVVPSGAASGQETGYLLAVPSSSSPNPSLAGASVQAMKTVQTLGTPDGSVAQINGQYMGQMRVLSGYSFVQEGVASNLPNNSFVSFYHTVSHTGFSGFFFAVIFAVITAVTFGAGAVIAGAMGAMLAVSTGTAAAIGTAVGALSEVLVNLATTGSAGLGAIQKNLVGGNCANTSYHACVGGFQVFNLNQSAQNAYSSGLQPGYTASDTNPTQPSNQWDWRPAAAQAIDSNMANPSAPYNGNNMASPSAPYNGNNAGGFETGYQQNALQPQQAVNAPSPGLTSQSSALSQAPGGGIDYGASPISGSLGTAPQ